MRTVRTPPGWPKSRLFSSSRSTNRIAVTSMTVVIRRFPALIHAELAKSALRAYGISATIVGGAVPVRKEIATIDLVVREQDVEAALDILGPEERFSG